MKANWVIGLILLCISPGVMAQKFWLTTYEFPGGPKTGIGLTRDSCLIVGLINGLLLSCNEGKKFDTILRTRVVFSVYSSVSGQLFAGGQGKIFKTKNLGQSWDSVLLHSNYPVVQIIENQQGGLFAITGGVDNNMVLNGDGVYFSSDGGNTWTQRNNGLGAYTSCERITIDKNGRLYLGVGDDQVSGQAGLFISENNGLLWEHIPISIDGRGAIPDQLRIGNTTGLAVSPEDSVLFSFTGIAVNVLVRLNIRKHIGDVRKTNFWKPYLVSNTASWWTDRPLNLFHFAKNGDWYSSTNGSILTGGTYFSKDKGLTWRWIDYGLGVDIFGERNVQYFTETPNGKIFMIQQLDERVYTADTSIITAARSDPGMSRELLVYPNPVFKEGRLMIKVSGPYAEHKLKVFDLKGRIIYSLKQTGNSLDIPAPEEPGLYYILVENKFSILRKPFMVF